MFTELDNPLHLDLSYNKFSDESLQPFIQYIFANEGSHLNYLNLSNNLFSNYGKRTLLVGYARSQNKSALQFKCGPLPLAENTIKLAFVIQTTIDKAIAGKGPNAEARVVK